MKKYIYLGNVLSLLKQEKMYEDAPNNFRALLSMRERFSSSIKNKQLFMCKDMRSPLVYAVTSVYELRDSKTEPFDIVLELGLRYTQSSIFGERHALKTEGLYFVYEDAYELKKFLRDFLRGIPEENHDTYKLSLSLDGVIINESSTCTD